MVEIHAVLACSCLLGLFDVLTQQYMRVGSTWSMKLASLTV